MARIKLDTLISIGSEIEQIVEDTGADYIDAALEYCRINNMEEETLGEILRKHQNITKQIRREAENLNYIKREESHEIEFDD